MEMTTKHLVIFGAGILAGYLLIDYLRKQNPSSATPPATTPPTPAVNPKEETCQAALKEHLTFIKMLPDNLESYKQSFMADCLSDTGMFSPTANQ
jgi:hypothetical protein